MEYKKFSQRLNGQFKKTSKKAQALFIGRSIQALTESLKDYEEKFKLKMDTLRFVVQEYPQLDEDGNETGWILLVVAYEVGSNTPFTEEELKALEEKKRKAEEERRKAEEQYGLAAMDAMDRDLMAQGIIPVQSKIQ